eukprot:scaffold4976_cov131-Isochrysis_galbana.AAC.3
MPFTAHKALTASGVAEYSFVSRLGGSRAVRRGLHGLNPSFTEEIKQLQTLLTEEIKQLQTLLTLQQTTRTAEDTP